MGNAGSPGILRILGTPGKAGKAEKIGKLLIFSDVSQGGTDESGMMAADESGMNAVDESGMKRVTKVVQRWNASYRE